MINDIAAALRRNAGKAALCLAGSAMVLASQACSAAHPPMGDIERSVLPVGVASGPCGEEGSTAPCHLETGRDGNIVNCFAGTQTCRDGAWSACGADSAGGATIRSVDISTLATDDPASAGGVSPLAVTTSEWSTAKGGCAQNPCNPYCVGADVDAGSLQPDGGLTSFIVGSTSTLSSFPKPKQAAQSASCTVGSPPANNAVCSYDYCCAATSPATTGTCQPWTGAPTACRTPTGLDFTTGIGCENGSGSVHIPVCNRGSADATTGKLLLAGYPGNPNSAASASVCTAPGSSRPNRASSISPSARSRPASASTSTWRRPPRAR